MKTFDDYKKEGWEFIDVPAVGTHCLFSPSGRLIYEDWTEASERGLIRLIESFL